MDEFEIREIGAQHAAVVRDELPMEELPTLFHRAFGEVMAVVGAQGLVITGPPFGFYPHAPGATVEVAAGFPVSGPVEPAGDVVPIQLPAGRAVTGVHVGPFEGLHETYDELLNWARAREVELADGMWESYLTDPAAEPDQSKWRTAITWPIR